jgi:HlyD family secretion protein
VGDQALLRSSGIATSQSTTGTEEAKDFKVVVTLDTPTDELRPGLSCTTKITTAHKPAILTLPIQALTLYDPNAPTGKDKEGAQTSAKPNPVQGVFIVQKDAHGRMRAKFVPVTTGITGATEIELLSGLNEGQEIVTGPYKTLRELKNDSLLKRDTVKVNLTTSSGS